MLPFGLRTQDEDGDVTLGTVPSAPRGPHMLKVVIRTTIVSLMICGVFYGLTKASAIARRPAEIRPRIRLKPDCWKSDCQPANEHAGSCRKPVHLRLQEICANF